METELSDRVSAYGEIIYQNSDGRILVNLGLDGGNLFKSRADCVKYIEELQQAIEKAKLESSLSYRIPQGQSFIDEIPKLFEQLSVQLKIPLSELDNSADAMSKLDRAIKRIGRNKCLQPDIFAPLVAYVGEVIRQATGGKWILRFSEDEKAWEPWIIDSRGDVHPPFIIILKELLDKSPYSVSNATIWEIQAYREGIEQGWIHGREQGWQNKNL
ncbi:MAG TPA: hypothetical protein V6D25_18455 [Leptolyngbyaceae cyanobacterium]